MNMYILRTKFSIENLMKLDSSSRIWVNIINMKVWENRLYEFKLQLRRQGREADHSPPSSAEVKECVELYLHSPNTPSWRGA
jgi:hypothetical protein